MRYGEGNAEFDVSDEDVDVPPGYWDRMRGVVASAPDIADEPIEPAPDNLATVLDIAAEIDLEYGPDPGMTRVERLARFVRANFGGAVYARSVAGAVSRSTVMAHAAANYGRVEIERMATLLAVRTFSSSGEASRFVPLTPTLARTLATALLVEAEDAERAKRDRATRSAYRGEF